jgi:hypothetical protein
MLKRSILEQDSEAFDKLGEEGDLSCKEFTTRD